MNNLTINDYVEAIYEAALKTKGLQGLFIVKGTTIKLLCEFYHCSNLQAVLIALVLHAHLHKKSISFDNVRSCLKMNETDMLEVDTAFQIFLGNNYVKSKDSFKHGTIYKPGKALSAFTYSKDGILRFNIIKNQQHKFTLNLEKEIIRKYKRKRPIRDYFRGASPATIVELTTNPSKFFKGNQILFYIN